MIRSRAPRRITATTVLSTHLIGASRHGPHSSWCFTHVSGVCRLDCGGHVCRAEMAGKVVVQAAAHARGLSGLTLIDLWEAASFVDGPQLARAFFVRSTGRLQSCVQPFGAISHDRWPLWFPQIEALSVGRDRNPAEAVRLLSIRRVTDCAITCFTLASLRHAAAQQVMLPLLRVGRYPVCS